MPEASIKARLGLDTSDFKAPLKDAAEDVKNLSAKIKEGNAAVAEFQRAMRAAGGGTAEQKKQLKEVNAELATYRSQLKQAEREAKAFGAAAPAKLAMPTASRPFAQVSYGAATAAGGPSGGLGSAGGQELFHSGRAVLDGLLAGQSPIQALGQQIPRLAQAFSPLIAGLGALLVPIGALIGGGAFIKWLHGAAEEAKSLRQETGLLGTNLGSLSGASVESLAKSLEAAREQEQKLSEKNGSFSNALVNGLTGQGVNNRDVAAARSQRYLIENRLNDTQARDQGYERRAFNGDQSVEQEKLATEYAEKRDEIIKKAAKDQYVDATRALQLLKEEYDLRQEMLERTQQAKQIELDLETQLIAIQRSGLNLETDSSQARLSAARKALANGPQEGPEHQSLLNRFNAADVADQDAQQKHGQEMRALAARQQLAGLRGSPDQMAAERLRIEREQLQANIDSDPHRYETQQVKDWKTKLEENRAQMAEFNKGQMQKGFQAEGLGIQSETGRGADEQVHAIERRLGLLQQEREFNRKSNGDDVLENAKLSAEAHGLLMQKEDILFAQNQTLEAAKATTREMELQTNGNTTLAKTEAIRAQYHERIAAALFSGNAELAKQLGAQQSLALAMAGPEEFRKTPMQRSSEELARQKQRQDLKAMQGQEERKANRMAANDADGSFNDFFNPGQALVDRIMPAPNLDWSQQPDDDGTSEIVEAINKQTDAIIQATTYHR